MSIPEGKQEAEDDTREATTLAPAPQPKLSAAFGLFGSSRRPSPTLNPNALPMATQTPGQVRIAVPETRPRPRPKGAPPPSPGIRVTQMEKRQALAQFAHEEENLPEFIINQTSFHVWGAQEVRDQGVVQVKNPEDTGYNTVNDPMMGTVDPRNLCTTCSKDNINCPGHFGYIDLEDTPVYHPLFLQAIVRVLGSICNSCGGLLLSEDQIREEGFDDFSGDERLKMIRDKSLKKPCRKVHAPEETVLSPDTAQFAGMSPTSAAAQGDVKSCKNNPIYASPKQGEYLQYYYEEQEAPAGQKHNYIEMKPEEAYRILNSISDEDAQTLGFVGGTHPRNMIIKVLAVMPPCVRSANLREGMIGTDYYGYIYKEIVKKNILYHEPSTDRTKREEHRLYIQRAVTALIIGYSFPALHVSESFKPIRKRIQDKKAGVIRGSMSGKRVNFSARTVVGPDPSLRFYQTSLPEEWRSKLTRDIPVEDFSIGGLSELLRQGRVTHVTPSEGRLKGQRIKVTDGNRDKMALRPGDIVTRWGQDGDMVLLNRQPTIHKQGIMGYEAVFRPGRTIGISLSVTTPHNADFDGDEMNVHAVQTMDAVIDVLGKMDVRQCIINSQDNKPIIAPIMDSLTAAYKLTQDNVYVDNDLWGDITMNIIANDGLPTLEARFRHHNIIRTVDPSDGVPKYSGRALFSTILPPDFYYKKGGVLVLNGVLVAGTLDKKTLGTSHNSMIQVLYKIHGNLRVIDFLTDAPRLLERWLTAVGFSVGLADCDPLDAEQRQMVRDEVNKVKIQASQLGVRIKDPLENTRREREIAAKVGQASSLGARLSEESLTADNALNVMALSGAKGSVFNIQSITGVVGHQYIRGGLAPAELTGGRRSLAYFKPDEVDPEARGFVSHSFMEGLTPAEMMFHQTAGREGLIDTANKTADVGALHRDIVKLLEDVQVGDDGSVRGTNNKLIQPIYGDDGFDGKNLQMVKQGTEDMPFFIDVEGVAGFFNAKYGYYPE